jgi:hypothetical protein
MCKIWSLNMSMYRKILVVVAIFMLAAVSLAAAIVRFMIQLQISHGGYAAHTNITCKFKQPRQVA